VHGFYVKQAKAGLVAPVEKSACGPVIGFAGIWIADVGGEEFDEAAAGVLAARGDQSRRYDSLILRKGRLAWVLFELPHFNESAVSG
jgi:hypothetical protein